MAAAADLEVPTTVRRAVNGVASAARQCDALANRMVGVVVNNSVGGGAVRTHLAEAIAALLNDGVTIRDAMACAAGTGDCGAQANLVIVVIVDERVVRGTSRADLHAATGAVDDTGDTLCSAVASAARADLRCAKGRIMAQVIDGVSVVG
jgi:hypothetical protein